MTEPRHWIRPLKDGVEFFFAAAGSKLSGSAGSMEAVAGLRALFEQHAGVELPAPEVKAMRGAAR